MEGDVRDPRAVGRPVQLLDEIRPDRSRPPSVPGAIGVDGHDPSAIRRGSAVDRSGEPRPVRGPVEALEPRGPGYETSPIVEPSCASTIRTVAAGARWRREGRRSCDPSGDQVARRCRGRWRRPCPSEPSALTTGACRGSGPRRRAATRRATTASSRRSRTASGLCQRSCRSVPHLVVQILVALPAGTPSWSANAMRPPQPKLADVGDRQTAGALMIDRRRRAVAAPEDHGRAAGARLHEPDLLDIRRGLVERERDRERREPASPTVLPVVVEGRRTIRSGPRSRRAGSRSRRSSGAGTGSPRPARRSGRPWSTGRRSRRRSSRRAL